MNNKDVISVRSLMSKLATLSGELTSEEQAAFSDIVQLAAKSARELSEEEMRAASGGARRADGYALAGFRDVGMLAKGQSSHPKLVAEGLAQFKFPDVGILAKGQSTHPTLIASELAELQASFQR